MPPLVGSITTLSELKDLTLSHRLKNSMTNNFQDAKREQTSILAPLERAALRGLARRMPRRINSDHLSLLGLVAMFMAGVCYAASGQNPLMLHLVIASTIVFWLSRVFWKFALRHYSSASS